MEFYDVINERKSIRKYKNTPVERAAIDRLIEAARLAPSWKNRQCARYIVISDAAERAALGSILNNPSAECYINAPYAIVLCADSSDSGINNGKDYYLVDCGISMEHLVLAATAEGLGTCWVGAFRETDVRNLLGIPQDIAVVAITPVGYPDETPPRRPRMELNEITMEGKYCRK